jgi:hypothetical protein
MMKFATLTAQEFGVPITVSLNSIMVDGDRDVRGLPSGSPE